MYHIDQNEEKIVQRSFGGVFDQWESMLFDQEFGLIYHWPDEKKTRAPRNSSKKEPQIEHESDQLAYGGLRQWETLIFDEEFGLLHHWHGDDTNSSPEPASESSQETPRSESFDCREEMQEATAREASTSSTTSDGSTILKPDAIGRI